MNSRLIYAIGYLIFAVFSFKNWKESKNKDFLWFFGFSGVGFVADLIYYFLIISDASQNTLSLAESFFFIFDPIMVITVVGIGIRGFTTKR